MSNLTIITYKLLLQLCTIILSQHHCFIFFIHNAPPWRARMVNHVVDVVVICGCELLIIILILLWCITHYHCILVNHKITINHYFQPRSKSQVTTTLGFLVANYYIFINIMLANVRIPVFPQRYVLFAV